MTSASRRARRGGSIISTKSSSTRSRKVIPRSSARASQLNSVLDRIHIYSCMYFFKLFHSSLSGSIARRGGLFLLVLTILWSPSPRSNSTVDADSQNRSEPGIQELRSLVLATSGKPGEQDLVRLESKYRHTRTEALARFLRGYLHLGGGAGSQAADAFDESIIGSASALGDYALFYRADAEAASGAAQTASKDYARIADQYADSILKHDALLKSAEISIQLGDAKRAVELLRPMSEALDGEAMYLRGLASEKQGDISAAVRLYRSVYYHRPATRSSEQVLARLVALKADPAQLPGSLEEETARGDAFFDSKLFAESARAYEHVIALFPAAAASNDALNLRLGISLLNNKQPSGALPALMRVSERGPEAQAEAMYYQVEAYRRAEQAAQAAAATDKLLARFPKSKWAENALFNLANTLNKQGRTAEASTRFRQLVTAFPSGDYAPEASYNLGWHAYQSRQFSDAARLLEQHIARYRYPASRYLGEAGLWAGKSEEYIGGKARALALYDLVAQRYRYGYHGYIAGRRAAALRAANPSLRPEEPRPGSDLEHVRENLLFVDKVVETWDGSESKRVARADDLEIIGLSELAIREMNEALKDYSSSPKLNLRLAQTYARRGDSFQATLILRRGYPDLYSYAESDVPREAWEIFFPLRNWDLIKQEAKRYGLDPYMAAGLIRQESVFNPTAISHSGARGLMQLMPATAQLIAKRQGGERVTTADLYNPLLNIKLGMGYLADMMGQFGRIEFAAAAYNAGPGRARQWIAERGSSDIEDWIESIPFSETRGYVQGVLRYAANYRRLYKD
ncbi:MAG: hypothetical protein DMF61_00090 [Blastocatellia bacterium AA13]|nr:MAG: hypothetical protein DMF61_00090 [Blastocatellia bacterium AA13]